MSQAEMLRLAVFGSIILAVYVSAGALLVLDVRRRIAGRPGTRSRRARLARGGVYALALLGVACAIYARFVEPWWLEVSRTTLVSAKVPPGSGPVRILHVSDAHCDPVERIESRVCAAAAELAPDLILFTGDAANSRAGMAVFAEMIARLAEVAPVYAVRGNWDLPGRPGGALPTVPGLEVLSGRARRLECKGVPISLIGIDAGDRAPAGQRIADEPPERLTVVLHHFPGRIPQAARAGADLYLAGHTHGGQVALPFYGALVTLARHGKRFEGGHYAMGTMHAFVSRGLGMEGAAPRVRFCARPEIRLIEIRPAESR